MKEDSIPCPTCSMPVKRKMARQLLKKCKTCKTIVCGYCSVLDICLDCHLKATQKMRILDYFNDKYTQPRGAEL